MIQAFEEIDCILFSLLILGHISGSNGYVWHCHPDQFYVVEVIIPAGVDNPSVTLLQMLPTFICRCPQDSLQNMALDEPSK